DDEMINAFAMPGGKVAVYSGLFKIATNDAQLAAVLGHEVGHVVARHGNERLSQGLVMTGIGVGLGVATANQSTSTRVAVLSAYGAGATLGVMLPFSRSQESEADYLGLIYMARAGYDPRQAVIVWQNMEKDNDSPNPPEFLSTHPNYQTRIERL
ncbi:MAG TPA: M48 family metallopeptidase, partial [Opitutales bacterium]|nr:M48 family metallopeptidase [Opitutales bacterium]